MALSSKDRFARDGFLVLENFVPAAACDALRMRAAELAAGMGPEESRTIFSTIGRTHESEAYFLASGDRIAFFFEAGAFGPDGSPDRPAACALNKIGHALHDLDPVFDRFSRRPELADLVAGLGVAEPLLLQSMVIFKQAGIGGAVVCHQDATFLYTEPQSVIGLWFALEDATPENGCLHAVPGGHRGPLRARLRRRPTGGTWLETRDPTPFPEADAVPLPVPKGSLIVLHGLLPHFSGPNRSARSRQAYSLHVIDGTAHYPADNWLRRGPAMPLRGF